MKREPTFYLSLAACGLAACCLWQAIAVREELDNLSRDMRNLNHTVQDQVSGIYSTVNRALEEEASILAEEDFTFGQVDMEARTVELLKFLNAHAGMSGIIYFYNNNFFIRKY